MTLRSMFPLLLLATLQAQSPESFLKMVPQLPQASSYCPDCGGGAEAAVRERFQNEVRAAVKKMDEILKPMDQRMKDSLKKAEQKMAEEMGAPAGAAGGKKKVSSKERQEMADQALKAQFGANAPSAQELKAMSKEERRAWAMSQAGGMAGGGPDPAKVQKMSQRYQDMGKGSERLAQIQTQFRSRAEVYRTKQEALNREYRELAKPVGRDYSSSGASGCEERRKACRALLPKMTALARQRLDEIKEDVGLWKEVEDIQARQVGLDKAPVPGLLAMQEIRRYLDALPNTFTL